jgi:hypothetical protein
MTDAEIKDSFIGVAVGCVDPLTRNPNRYTIECIGSKERHIAKGLTEIDAEYIVGCLRSFSALQAENSALKQLNTFQDGVVEDAKEKCESLQTENSALQAENERLQHCLQGWCDNCKERDALQAENQRLKNNLTEFKMLCDNLKLDLEAESEEKLTYFKRCGEYLEKLNAYRGKVLLTVEQASDVVDLHCERQPCLHTETIQTILDQLAEIEESKK